MLLSWFAFVVHTGIAQCLYDIYVISRFRSFSYTDVYLEYQQRNRVRARALDLILEMNSQMPISFVYFVSHSENHAFPIYLIPYLYLPDLKYLRRFQAGAVHVEASLHLTLMSKLCSMLNATTNNNKQQQVKR